MERQAQNFPIQCSSSDITFQAAIRIHKRFQDEKIDANLLFIIHDALVYEIKEEQFDHSVEIMKEEMNKKIPGLSIDMEVELKTGYKWGEVEVVKEDDGVGEESSGDVVETESEEEQETESEE